MKSIYAMPSGMQPNNDTNEALNTFTRHDRDALVISTIFLDGEPIIVSRYGDNVWKLQGFTTNTPMSHRKLNFQRYPIEFQEITKSLMYRYMRCGRFGNTPPKSVTLYKYFVCLLPFIRYLEECEIHTLRDVTPSIYADYVVACQNIKQTHRSRGKPLSSAALINRYIIIEILYELSQHTDQPIPQHPWPDVSVSTMVGKARVSSRRSNECLTPLIPDDIFCRLFNRATEQMHEARALLDLRDALEQFDCIANYNHVTKAKNDHLAANGFPRGLRDFNKSILDIRTSCYIVIASTSGCRNHELANIRIGAHYRTEDNEGVIYHWMRSKSEKTDTGAHSWMIPEAAVRALRIMERWSAPYQRKLSAEIFRRRAENPYDPEIAAATIHRNAVFVGCKPDSDVRTISSSRWNALLKEFCKAAGLDWELASHQFRRKFANYVAHSRFGDLRYLREHFAHWTIDMSLGYAMDDIWGEHMNIELLYEINSEIDIIKSDVVGSWFASDNLAGGYGRSIKGWQREPENLAIFKDHRTMILTIAETTTIRSNGHAWCTAGDNKCVGNSAERTRCATCENAVIGPVHASIYEKLHTDLAKIIDRDDIGVSGKARITRDVARCKHTLDQLSGSSGDDNID
jgi:hypothetical protein